MASRSRQSTAGPTQASRNRQSTMEPTQRPAGNTLPPYERPAFPLNLAGQRALEQLTRTHNLRKLEESLAEAQGALSNSAGEINDRLYRKEQATKKRRLHNEQNEGVDAGEDDDIEKGLDELRSKVDRMTQRMDESMRKMIDGQHSVQAIKDSLGATSADVRENAATQATQLAQTPQYEDFAPTDPAAGTQDQPTPIDSFKSKREDAKTRYQSFGLTQRYAENNDYRNFKRVVHDAKHPDGDVQLAHHSEWFDEDGQAPAPGMTRRPRANGDDEDDDDDDIAISRAVISTKCPLTLQEFKNPLSSKKCPHSFEADAIKSLIRGAGRGNTAVRCPVPGCPQMLNATDLHTDAVLLRQIKRLQRAKELEHEDVDDDDRNGQGGATIVEDGDDDVEDVDDIIEGRSTQLKKEPRSQVRPRNASTAVSAGPTAPRDVD